MFILYGVLIGLVLGFLVGGRPAGLASLQIRYGWLMIAGLLVQIVLFSPFAAERVGDVGPPVYVGSTLVVAGAILANLRIPGMALVGLGAISNLAAIVANGGYMPADPRAMAALGMAEPTTYSNSSVVPDPALWPLTDIFAMPAWLPWSNVFSVGDVIIVVGVALVIVSALRRPVEPETAAAS
ncbi:MAG TPA: DUF5317 family protein [Candidatus Limnocylindrales bacterium]|nr:DUF5317 family protein [Candidatus Limnocylindrales bacterium]